MNIPIRRATRARKGLLICALCLLGMAGCGGGGGSGGGNTSASTTGTPPSDPPASTSPLSPPPPVVANPPSVQIDVLLLLSESTRTLFGDPILRSQHLVNVANDILRDSGVATGLHITGQRFVDYPDAPAAEVALEALTYATHASLAEAPAWRDSDAADLVILLRPYADDGNCGYAWLAGSGNGADLSGPENARFGYAVVAINCPDYTFMHEVGHLLGLAHSRRESAAGGTLDSSVGYGVDHEFATIMASPQAYNATQLPRLSSPARRCNGQPCGIEHGSEDAADAVHTLNLTSAQVARYR